MNYLTEKGAIRESVSLQLAEFEKAMKELKAKEDEIKAGILQEMEEKGIIKIENDEMAISYIAPTTRETFDSKKLRADNPDLYDEYVKISQVKASIRLKVK